MSLLLQTLMKIIKKFRRRKLNEITIHFEQAVYQTMFEDSSLALPMSCIFSTSQYTFVNERSVSDFHVSKLNKDRLGKDKLKSFIYELKLYCP